MKRFVQGMYRIPGEGAMEVLTRAQKMEMNGRSILHFEVGQPDFPTHESIKVACTDAIDNNLTGYVPPDGTLELKKAIQNEIEMTRGYRPTLDQVVVVPGGKPGIYLPMIATCNPGDEVIYPDPGFPTYAALCEYTLAKAVPIPLKEESKFRLDPKDIAAKITPKTKLIILNSPQNPTGSMMTKKELDEVAKLAEEHSCYILSDEIYSKIVYDQEFHSPTSYDAASERSFLLDGFSKSYAMTGWRLGYIVVPEELGRKLRNLMTHAITCTAPFVQRAGVAALTGSQTHIEDMVKVFRERRDFIVSKLNDIDGISCITPQGAFYAWPNIKEIGKSSQELADFFLEEVGVACLPGTAFGPGGEGYLRFSYASSMSVISEAIERITKVLE